LTHYHYLTIEQRERLQAILQARLAELGEALARLHTPDYGVCTHCGADIPYVRLIWKAGPSAPILEAGP
jgi:RNA polymerase-binding transcription factor DksA